MQAYAPKTCMIFDLLTAEYRGEEEWLLLCLRKVLEGHAGTLKLLHDGRHCHAVLEEQLAIMLHPFVDTEVNRFSVWMPFAVPNYLS